MSTAEHARNKATFRHFCDAVSTGDAELISKTIDEVFEPDVLIRTPLPIEATGAQAMKEVFGRLRRAFPDLHVAVEDLVAEGDRLVSRNWSRARTRASTWGSRQPVDPSRTTRSSSSAS